MENASSDDDVSDRRSDRCGSYSLSADVSESESCSSFSYRRFDAEGASSSMSLASSPRPVAGKFVFPTPVVLPVLGGKAVAECWDEKPEKRESDSAEIDMMKERFAKLLLGEDMSGGGKGVCTALAISNAITNLSATVFGELWRLEPLAAQKKQMWRREMDWLLCVSDSIVELVPGGGGGTYEVMESRTRSDLHMNLPALKKLDAMLLGILEGFLRTEFSYVDRGIGLGGEDDDEVARNGRPSVRQEDKWWLPCPKLPPGGLSEVSRKRLQQCRDCTNQILKAAMSINSGVLAEMEIPRPYLASLPKSGKTCLGDIIYQYVTTDRFSPECLLDCLDLTSEHQTVEIANRVEAAVHVWRQKERRKQSVRSRKGRRPLWGGKVKSLVSEPEKNVLLARRAETLLQSLRRRFPGLPQTALDMNKIQFNRDVGQSILESYSRVMESLAFNIMARIDDILYVDDAIARCSSGPDSVPLFNRGGLGGLPIQKMMSPSPFSIQQTPYASPLATPTMFASTPLGGSPGRTPVATMKKTPPVFVAEEAQQDQKSEKLVSSEFERLWSYTGSLSSRRTSGDAPERD